MAPEGKVARQSKAMDVFSFGMLLYHCLSGGLHPFGQGYERDHNIIQVPQFSKAMLQLVCG